MYSDEEENIFAEFEKTLSENMLKSNVQQDPAYDIQSNHLAAAKLNTVCGPAYRGHMLIKATHAYKAKNYLDSVYYETAALSLWMRNKFSANKVVETKRLLPSDGNLKQILEKKDSNNKMDYIDSFLNDLPNEKVFKNVNFASGTELIDRCKELPKEWTVIQLCKQVNIKQHLQTRDECLRCPLPIFLTVFCYPRSEDFDHQPIKITLNQKDLNELYDTSYAHFDGYNKQVINSSSATSGEFRDNVLSKLKKLLGPWIVLFSGKTKSEIDEARIYGNVNKFVSESLHNYSKRQILLTWLIARRLFMLTRDDIRQASLFISTTLEEYHELNGFFLRLTPTFATTECYPVILVVDELIDFLYWEMCNTEQEFTRVESFVTLLQLHAYHEAKISNGYVNVKHRKGSALLNADGDLTLIDKDIHPMLTTALPNWSILQGKKPTFTELKTMLSESDIYIYNGHGSGFHFITAYETCQISTNAVVFLFGCSSVALRAKNAYASASGPHQYYHVAKSPAVIGNINLSYSNWCNLKVAAILRNWLLPDFNFNSVPVHKAGKSFWNWVNIVLCGSKKSPYLGKVIADFKRNEQIPITTRAMLCYRGLPVYLEK